MNRISLLGVCALLATRSLLAQMPPSIVDRVDPFIGVDTGGGTLPGSQVPFGFVALSPDATGNRTSGYNSAGDITGFSHTHVSGTGGASKYGNFRVTPLSGDLRVSDLGSSKSAEQAAPGYYSVVLEPSGIRAELTSSRMVGLHRYTFPTSSPAYVLLDIGSVVTFPSRPRGTNQRLVTCEGRFIPPDRFEGSADFVGGWNPNEYALNFSGQFDRPFTGYGTWVNDKISSGSADARGEGNVGLYASFDDLSSPSVVQLKVGVSFISRARAREHMNWEMPIWDFDRVRVMARELWRETLGRIAVEGGTPDQLRIFYTALYHCHVMPHDLSGENAWWDSEEPHYEDFYAIWDTFRTLHPLLTLIQPKRQRDMLRSLVDTYRHTGWMPDARIAGANGLMQGGTNGDVLIADAMVKGMDMVAYDVAWEAMKRNAEYDSPRPRYEGRVLADYKKVGYLTTSSPLSASRTMEYAYNDFCLAQVAKAKGLTADYEKYLKRSGNWANLWDDSNKSIRPRNADGSWVQPFDRTQNFPSAGGAFYEGNPWQYSTFVPHDVQGLINRVGGDEAFVRWLDAFFDGGYHTQGNEPDILSPYLYIHAGRPDRTAERVRKILSTSYGTKRNGLPGDDDAGTMSAWYVWGAIGLYPNAGQDYYYIGSPIFPRSEILMGNHRLTIEAPNTSEENLYVQSAKWNGEALNRSFLYHRELAEGGKLELVMGPKPNPKWGAVERPYSVSGVSK